MSLLFRKSIDLGLIRWNFGRGGYSSTTYRIWPWSYNTRTRRHRIDLPGPFAWQSAPRPRRAQ
jgi:hypothetical protein